MSRKFSEAEIKTIKNIVLTLGVRGGFKSLSYEYLYDGVTPCNSGISGSEFKRSADKVMEVFIEYDLPIKTLTKV